MSLLPETATLKDRESAANVALRAWADGTN